MKFLKNTLFWALLAIAGLAQDASASRFIVWGDTIQKFIDADTAPAESLLVGMFGISENGILYEVVDNSLGKEWEPCPDAKPLVIEADGIQTIDALKDFAYSDESTAKDDKATYFRFEGDKWWKIHTIRRNTWEDLFASVDAADKRIHSLKLEELGQELGRLHEIAKSIRDLQAKEQALIKALGNNLGRQYACLMESGVKNLTPGKIAALIQALGAIPEEQQTEKSKQKLAWLRAAVKPAEAGDDASEGDGDESDDGKAPKGDEDPADPKGKPKPKDEPKSLYSRCMSVHAGYRYGGAHVAFILAASMLQVMYEGYRGVGFEAKDLAEHSALKKVLRAFKVSLSPARHAANAKALFRVLRPQAQKGVVTPKILARAKQFAKDKPLVLAGLLSLIAVDVYGVCVHADDIKAFVQSLRK